MYRDNIIFDFQVTTSMGSVSHYYNLGIIVPRAYILGADEYYAMAGGDISLVCIIEDVRLSKINFICKTFFDFRLLIHLSMCIGITMTK